MSFRSTERAGWTCGVKEALVVPPDREPLSYRPGGCSSGLLAGCPIEFWNYKRLFKEVLIDKATTIAWCKLAGKSVKLHKMYAMGVCG